MTDEQFISWLRTMPNLGTALYQLREMQQLTQHEVAELAGVTRPYIAHVERGDRMPERDTLIAILLAALSLPIPQANRVLLFAKYAPLHHVSLATSGMQWTCFIGHDGAPNFAADSASATPVTGHVEM